MGEEGDKSGCRQALRTLHNCIEKENKEGETLHIFKIQKKRHMKLFKQVKKDHLEVSINV